MTEFGDISISKTSSKIKGKVLSPLVYSYKAKNSSGHVLCLIDTPFYERALIDALKIWLISSLKGLNFDIVASTVYKATQDQIKKIGVEDFYRENRSDFASYIQENTVVLSMGRAIAAITLNSDIQVDAFYDVNFNKSWFYSPHTGTYVFPIDDLFQLFKKTSQDVILKDCSRVEFAKFQVYQIKSRYTQFSVPPELQRIVRVRLKTKEEFLKLCEDTQHLPWVSKDIETSGLDYRVDRIGDLTLSFDGVKGYYIPWRIVDKTAFTEMLRTKKQIGANSKFDDKFLRHNEISTARTDSDVVNLGKFLNEMRSNSLKSLAFYYTQSGGYDEELTIYKKVYNIKNYLDIPEEIRAPYAIDDAIYTYQVNEALQSQLDDIDKKFPPIHEHGWSLRRNYEELRIPMLNTFTNIEMRGVVMDKAVFEKSALFLEEKIQELKKKVTETIKFDVSGLQTSFEEDNEEDLFSPEDEELDSLTSGKKLGEHLEKIGWEDLGRAKAGFYLTGDEQLILWEQIGHEEAALLRKLRSALTMQKTFIGNTRGKGGWQRYLQPTPDGYFTINPTYGSMATDSNRNSCYDPNFQQLPSSAEDAKLMKQTIRSKNDDLLITLDYSAFQMRLAALDVGDVNDVLYQAYKNNPNVDLHSKTAFNVFCKDAPFKILESVEVEQDGKKYVLRALEEVKIIDSAGQEKKKKAKDLIESDILIGV